MTTRFYALFPNTEPETIPPEAWTEWRNMNDDRDESRIMVLRQFIHSVTYSIGPIEEPTP